MLAVLQRPASEPTRDAEVDRLPFDHELDRAGDAASRSSNENRREQAETDARAKSDVEPANKSKTSRRPDRAESSDTSNGPESAKASESAGPAELESAEPSQQVQRTDDVEAPLENTAGDKITAKSIAKYAEPTLTPISRVVPSVRRRDGEVQPPRASVAPVAIVPDTDSSTAPGATGPAPAPRGESRGPQDAPAPSLPPTSGEQPAGEISKPQAAVPPQAQQAQPVETVLVARAIAALPASSEADTATGRGSQQSSSMPQPPASDGVDSQTANTSRIARGLQTVLAQRGGAVTLRLTPPDLGTLRIQLQISGSSVSAGFLAETESARGVLTQQLGQLRAALENAGLSVERLSVQLMQTASTNLQQHGGQSAADGRSRGEYAQQGRQGEEPAGEDPGPQARRSAFEELIEDHGSEEGK